MGSKRAARRNKKNAQLAAPTAGASTKKVTSVTSLASDPPKGVKAGDILSDPFFRADSLAPAELDARAGVAETGPDGRMGEPRKWSAEAKARRARFGKYVVMTVGACTIVLALAGVRHAMGARSNAPSAAARHDVPIRPPPPPPSPPPPASDDDVEPTSEIAPPPERFVESTDTDRNVARREKRESQRALELGHVPEAIERGEKSVAVDPTDREAWLILGAAYQHAGAHEDARRCFQACLTQGKHGATWECAAMLR
jgi:hypothetical protein